MDKRKTGFTLAEVLITLAVIGVVAALTIPVVIKNYKDTQTVSQQYPFCGFRANKWSLGL